MTFGNILTTALGSSSSRLDPRVSNKSNHDGDYFLCRIYHKGKEKSKSDKKHAILSALTLLAFLFFLNVLQNCIKEQYQNRGTVTMFAPTGPTAQQSKEPNSETNQRPLEKNFRKKRSLLGFPIENPTFSNKQNHHVVPPQRTVFPFSLESVDNRRQKKFIRNYNNVGNWTGELSQVSQKDLKDHKLKTMNFPLYWKNNRLGKPTSTRQVTSSSQMKSKNIEAKNKTEMVRNGSSRIGTPERQTTPVSITSTPKYSIPIPVNKYSTYSPIWRTAEKLQWDVAQKNFSQSTVMTTITPPLVSTPRNRRSDVSGPPEYEDRDAFTDDVRQDLQYPSTPAVGLDLNTFQTFPVYNYYGYRYGGQGQLSENHSTNTTASGSSGTSDAVEVNQTPAEVRIATEPPTFYPAKPGLLSYGKYPMREKISSKHPNHHAYYHQKIHRPLDYRIKYSPYRKAGILESSPSHFHDYHGPLIVARYPITEEESGFDVGKFLWKMFTSFAKPLANLVPSFAKENTEEAQCYDLFVCEAQRVSKLMGPTAEALAATVGTLLSWAATEDTRQIVADAINSGRDNTCQQQIKDCEDRSGGKSAMTVFAQVMEMKLR